jgi:hypothetical protein
MDRLEMQRGGYRGAGRFLGRCLVLGKRDRGERWRDMVHACTTAMPWPASPLAKHK